MSRVFYAGQELTEKDLKVQLRNDLNLLVDAFSIFYAIVDKTQGFDIVIDNIINRVPVRSSVGSYYANYTINPDATPGEYEIRWYIKETEVSETVEYFDCFTVVKDSTLIKRNYPDYISRFLMGLRIRLADNDPDKNYRFAPPKSVAEAHTFTTNHGYIWQDYELIYFLEEAVHKINYYSRNTNYTLSNIPQNMHSHVVDGAAMFALEHIVLRWIQDEYSYSLNGISLDLKKSSEYANMLNYYKDKVETDLKHIEEHRSHTIKGLTQEKFSVGYGYKGYYTYRGAGAGSWRRS